MLNSQRQKPIKFVRVYLSEGDKHNNHNLMQEIFRRLHDEHKIHGVTVFRGIAGFGRHGQVHSADLLRINVNLPLVVEFFDDPEAVDEALEWLQDEVPPGHIVVWDGSRL